MSLSHASTPVLVALAAFAVAAYAVAEHSLAPVHAHAYRTKLGALGLMRQAEQAIASAKRVQGVAIDARNDPTGSGVVGPQFSLITTDRGSQAAKSLAAHPEFAAAVTQMLLRARVREGDLIAVGVTGSLPGFNLAVMAACRAVGAEPIVITSAGSSMFGATDPEMTWLDMESVVVKKRLWPQRSIAASLGGGGDVGRGLSPAGRQLLADAIHRNGVRLLDARSVFEAVKQRVAIYDSVAASYHKPIKLYINVGGGVASLGGPQNGRLIHAGLSHRLVARNLPNRGVITIFAERRVPIMHLLQVETLAREFSISEVSDATTAPRPGPLFIKYRYNPRIVATAALLVLLSNLFVLRLDIRQKVLGQPHPERIHRDETDK
jgi:poly-gamma-glutamate system protein